MVLFTVESVLLWLSLSCAVVFGQDLRTKTDDYGVKPPDRCEVCKLLVREFLERLAETADRGDDVETGYALGATKKRIPFARSELRLYEALLDPHICLRMRQYRLHKERQDSTRFERGMSQTFKELQKLVDRGVKVETGIPNELWDSPPAEVGELERSCYSMVDQYEEQIEEWYYQRQDEDLYKYLCANLVLPTGYDGCLYEKFHETVVKETSKTEL